MPDHDMEPLDRGNDERSEAQEDATAAFNVLRSHAATSQNPAVHWFNSGLMAERSGNRMAAANAFAEAVASRGARPRYWYFYGRSLDRMQDRDRANYAYAEYARRSKLRHRPFLKHSGGLLDYAEAIRASAMPRPEYGHALYHAALLANALKIKEIRVAEFGVAWGRGLLALEDHADEIFTLTGVRLHITGFDTGIGLPATSDAKDIPYFFGEGDYPMEEDELRRRLRHAELILGNASDNISSWLKNGPPVGALLFDMDLYSSTIDVLRQLGDAVDERYFLPRVSTTFDDVVAKGSNARLNDYNEFTGESAAIRDFNSENETVKIASDRFFATYSEHKPWHETCYVIHRFSHHQYNLRIREGTADLRLPGRGP